MSGKYDDMIHLPHHQSSTRPHMSMHDRAAQFSPFAALVGYDEAVREEARLTERRVELDADAIARLDAILQRLRDGIASRPEAAITYFVPDGRKDGGAYVTVTGPVKGIRDVEQTVIMEDGTTIPISEIIEIEAQVGNHP